MLKHPKTVRDGGLVLCLFGLALACATGTLEEDEPGSGATGGTGGAQAGSGGQAGTATGQGGSVTTGGAVGSGGAATGGSGGAVSSGGTGGTTGGVGGAGGATGGVGGANGGVGGANAMGGANATGGAGGSLGGAGGTSGSAGSVGTGGAIGTGGAVGTGGVNAMGGAGGMPGGSGGAFGKGGGGAGGSGNAGKGGSGNAGTGAAGMPSSACSTWPTANGSQSVSSTIQVSGTYDGQFKRFSGSGALGGSGQGEGQGPLFEISNGGTLKNVILGNPAADGVHCSGNCTLENVWWEDVGEDAATFRGASSSQVMTVRCGGAKNATDKVFQHNGGGTLTIQDFQVNGFSKLYRSCGNCGSQYARHVVLQNVSAASGSTLVGINTNYGDTADFERITITGNITICERYTGNNNGGEPVKTGSGPDSQYCRYQDSDITKR